MSIDLERRTMRKIFWRLMPILMLGSAFHNLDRSNIAFASIKMNADLGLNAAQFGLAAGIYYLGYVLFCVPAGLMGPKVGLRLWLPIVMVLWGACSMATALAGNAVELGAIRFVLGAAEAGFVPGALFLLALWIPEGYRGRFIAWFWIAASVGTVVGSPLSAYILTFDHIAGLRSWQMLFVAEAAPICLAGLIGYWFLHDNPTKAIWLDSEERAWLVRQQSADPRRLMAVQQAPRLREFGNPRVLMLSTAYFLVMTMGISFSFFFPPYLHSRGTGVFTIGLGVALVHIMGAVAHPIWGRWSDRQSHSRQFVCFMGACLSASALCLLPLASGLGPILLLGGLVQMGLNGAVTSFWPLPMAAVRASAVAGVLAGITLFGNVTGIIGPYLTGYLRDRTDSYWLSFSLLAGCMALAGVLVLASRLVGSDHVASGAIVADRAH